MTTAPVRRPPYDPELAAVLPAVNEVLPPSILPPPAFVDVCSTETFRDEDIAYAGALGAAGVQTELHVWPGGFHGVDSLAPDAPLAQQARAARVDWLRRVARF